jgi:hypothetical protein
MTDRYRTANLKPSLRPTATLPVASEFLQILGVDPLNTGFGLPSGNMHGPNEKLLPLTWHIGIGALNNFFYNLAVI